jgi:hypothetical protein
MVPGGARAPQEWLKRQRAGFAPRKYDIPTSGVALRDFHSSFPAALALERRWLYRLEHFCLQRVLSWDTPLHHHESHQSEAFHLPTEVAYLVRSMDPQSVKACKLAAALLPVGLV